MTAAGTVEGKRTSCSLKRTCPQPQSLSLAGEPSHTEHRHGCGFLLSPSCSSPGRLVLQQCDPMLGVLSNHSFGKWDSSYYPLFPTQFRQNPHVWNISCAQGGGSLQMTWIRKHSQKELCWQIWDNLCKLLLGESSWTGIAVVHNYNRPACTKSHLSEDQRVWKS